MLIDNYFGFADNLKLGESGDLFIGTVTVRDHLRQFLLDKPFLRKFLMHVPERMAYALTPRHAGGVRVNTRPGEIKDYLFGAPTKTSYVTSIV